MPFALNHVMLETVLHLQVVLVDEFPSHSCHSSPAVWTTFNLLDVLDVDVVLDRKVQPLLIKQSSIPSYVHPNESNLLVPDKIHKAEWITRFTPTYIS